MPTVTPSPGPVPAWMEVLDRIDQALTESLARAAAPEGPVEPPGGAAHAARLALDVLVERQGRLQAILDRAAREAGEADSALASVMEDIEKWLQAVRAAREKPARQEANALAATGVSGPLPDADL